MRFGFVTCVELGRSCVESVLANGGRFELLVTLEDDIDVEKSGRISMDDLAQKHEIPLAKVRNINEPAAIEQITSANLDWLFIIGWSQIAKSEILSSAQRGVLGMHPTLLPIGRGRASIPWAILKDLEETGVTMFRLDEGVDTGPILVQQRIEIEARETATTLYSKVNQAHVELMLDAWPLLLRDEAILTPQMSESSTVWPRRRPEDGEIRPESMSMQEVDRLVRATTHPYPGAFLRDPDGTILRVWEGFPVESAPAGAVVAGREIATRDGTYVATDYITEVPPDPKTLENNQ